VYGPRGIVQIAPIATTRQLHAAGARAFGLVADDSTEGAYIGAFVDTVLHARRVALLYHLDEFGTGIRNGVVTELARRDLQTVDERSFAPEGATTAMVDVGVLLAAALRSTPDAIVLGARIGETREVAAYLRQHRLKIPVVCSDGSYVLPPDQRDLSDVVGFYVVRFWSPERDSSAARFARVFRQRYGFSPDQSEALTYDALMMIGAAVKGGARSADDFARALNAMGRSAPAFVGIDGPYQFVEGRPRPVRAEIAVVRGGALQHFSANGTKPQ
jgi:ABC-type branched-subunit amino acid transport system substrate-binding protein